MAISPEPREDLMRQATAMPLRGLFHMPGLSGNCFVGFRTCGSASIYFDEDPVLHFDSQNRLRRLYWQGKQFVADQGRLKCRTRSGPGGRITLSDSELTSSQQSDLIRQMASRLQRVGETMRAPAFQWIKATDSTDQLQSRVLDLVSKNCPLITIGEKNSL